MLKLKQLVARTTEERKQKATYVKIVRMKAGHLRNGLGYVAAETYSSKKVNAQGQLVSNPKKTRYLSMITFVDAKLNVHVACSCLDNTMRWEWANANKGAAVIEYSNGEPPNVTNPMYKTGLCKHLFALVEKIKPKLPSGSV